VDLPSFKAHVPIGICVCTAHVCFLPTTMPNTEFQRLVGLHLSMFGELGSDEKHN